MKFSFKGTYSRCDQIRRKLRIWGGGGWASDQIFKKGGGAWKDLIFQRGLLGKRGWLFPGGLGSSSFYIKQN